jgi:hypothetical protein
MAAAGNPNIVEQLLKGVTLGGRTYKNHLEKGPSKRHEIWYFGGAELGALRVDNFKFAFFVQPWGWPGEKITTDMPIPINLRQDPFERTPNIRRESPNTGASATATTSCLGSIGVSSRSSSMSRSWR